MLHKAPEKMEILNSKIFCRHLWQHFLCPCRFFWLSAQCQLSQFWRISCSERALNPCFRCPTYLKIVFRWCVWPNAGISFWRTPESFRTSFPSIFDSHYILTFFPTLTLKLLKPINILVACVILQMGSFIISLKSFFGVDSHSKVPLSSIELGSIKCCFDFKNVNNSVCLSLLWF